MSAEFSSSAQNPGRVPPTQTPPVARASGAPAQPPSPAAADTGDPRGTPPPSRPLVIGVIGGIGSGKSALARWLSTHDPRLVVFDADAAGHRALQRPEVIAALQKAFGPGVLSAEGVIDRRWLARRVFGEDLSCAAAREQLEAIVHPRIRAVFDEFRGAHASSAHALLLDAAVLLEAGWDAVCDRIVYVDAPEPVRSARALARGWTREEFTRREASQLSLSVKRARANFCVDNSGSLDTAGLQVYEYIRALLSAIH